LQPRRRRFVRYTSTTLSSKPISASGIGRATAIAYAKSEVEGICLADISSSGLKEVLQECDKVATSPNFRAITIEIDVSKEDDVKGMVEETVSTFGRIDYAANIDRVRDYVFSV